MKAIAPAFKKGVLFFSRWWGWLFAAGLLAPRIASANPISYLATAITSGILASIGDGLEKSFAFASYFIYQIGGQFLILMGALLDVGIELNRQVLESPFVLSGFEITLSVANLGFVLAIIVIAFTTILGLEGYETKKLLRNLIIAAVLVNFSLAIAGVVLDFTGVLTDFFLDRIAPPINPVDLTPTGTLMRIVKVHPLAEKLSTAFNVPKIQAPNPDNLLQGALQGGVKLGGEAVTGIFGFFFAVIFQIVVLLAMGIVQVMIWIRYLVLSFLLVVMPLAWLCWTLPGLKGQWQKWWNKFLKWAFFMPIAIFFIYLAVFAVAGIDAKPKTVPDGILGLLAGTLGTFAQMFVSVGLVIGGIMIARNLGITSAKAGMNIMKAMGKGFLGYKKGGLDKLAGKIGKGAAAGIAKVPLLRGFVGVFSPQVRREKIKLRERQAEAITGTPAVIKKGKIIREARPGRANELIEAYRDGTKTIEEIENLAKRLIIRPLGGSTSAVNRETAAARVAMATIEREEPTTMEEFSYLSGVPGVSPPARRKPTRLYQRMVEELETKKRKGRKVRKKEKKSEWEEKLEKIIEEMDEEKSREEGEGREEGGAPGGGGGDTH